jgi:deazaflavin-dependent oxidoreductase (nitroreductase family)
MREDTRARLEHWGDARFARLGIWLYVVTRGRLSRVLARRRTLLLRTRGRRTGRPRTVVLQYFPAGDDLLVVAANAGLARNPDWYHNLLADPDPSVLVEGRALHVTPRECAAEERDELWDRVLSSAPDYERYRLRTARQIPLVRLTPARTTHVS